MAAKLRYLVRIVDEELSIEIHLIEVGGEDVASILRDLDIALSDDGLALDLIHVIGYSVGTELLSRQGYTLYPVGHTCELRGSIVVADRGLCA